MYEISSAIVTLWTIGTFIFAMGFGWAGIKFGQRQNEQSVKEVKKDVKEIRECVKELKERLNKDEQNYMTKADCNDEQSECGKHRAYHESQILGKIQEVKNMIEAMNKTRTDDIKKELADAIHVLSSEMRLENDRQGGVNHT